MNYRFSRGKCRRLAVFKKWRFPIRTLHNVLVIGARLLHVDHGVKLASKNWLVHTKQKQMEGWLNTQEKYIPSGYLSKPFCKSPCYFPWLCCSHYIFPCFLSTPPFILSLSLAFSLSLCLSLSLFLSLSFSLSLSPPSFSLWLQDTCHLMPFTKYSLLDQSYLFHAISCHSSYKIHQLFTDYLLRLPSSELLEKRVFRSRANHRLVLHFLSRTSPSATASRRPGQSSRFRKPSSTMISATGRLSRVARSAASVHLVVDGKIVMDCISIDYYRWI